ncbi:FKBP-type peptidyl-prolyl cis-trans isomerase [Aurantivibrio infirmus]
MIGKQTMSLVVIAASILVLGCDKQAEEEVVTLETVEQRFSYAFGLNIGRQFKQEEINLDVDALALAIRDTYAEVEFRLSEEEIQAAVEEFQKEQQEKFMARQQVQEEENAKVAEENAKIGAEFLAANAEKEGVVTLDSGLQYKEIKPGEGAKPAADATVTVHYRGRLIDGTEFDSSYSRNQPASFPLQGVIAGWTEGLQLMSEGSTYELYVPAELAYGERGSPPTIGPNSTLIFEVELLQAAAAE